MVQVDLPGAFATGQLFALLSRRYLEREPRVLTSRLLGTFNLYMTCGFSPAGLLRWGVWMEVGTYRDFTSGTGYSFWSPPFFSGWLVVMSWLAVSSVATGLWFIRQGQRADRLLEKG